MLSKLRVLCLSVQTTNYMFFFCLPHEIHGASQMLANIRRKSFESAAFQRNSHSRKFLLNRVENSLIFRTRTRLLTDHFVYLLFVEIRLNNRRYATPAPVGKSTKQKIPPFDVRGLLENTGSLKWAKTFLMEIFQKFVPAKYLFNFVFSRPRFSSASLIYVYLPD